MDELCKFCIFFAISMKKKVELIRSLSLLRELLFFFIQNGYF